MGNSVSNNNSTLNSVDMVRNEIYTCTKSDDAVTFKQLFNSVEKDIFANTTFSHWIVLSAVAEKAKNVLNFIKTETPLLNDEIIVECLDEAINTWNPSYDVVKILIENIKDKSEDPPPELYKVLQENTIDKTELEKFVNLFETNGINIKSNIEKNDVSENSEQDSIISKDSFTI